MKKAVVVIAVALLILNGIGAVYGGMQLILYPDGSSLGMPVSFLSHSIFNNYLVPGIVLLVVNGLLSLAITGITVGGIRYYPVAIMLQGALLLGWLVIQMLILQFIFKLHLVMGVVGILLVASGIYLHRHSNTH